MKAMKHLAVVFATVLAVVFLGCTSRSPLEIPPDEESLSSTSTLVLYGRDSCAPCTVLMDELGNNDVPYTFRDIGENPGYHNEMWAKLHKIGVFGGSPLPVVDIQGTILIEPDAEQVRQLISQLRS